MFSIQTVINLFTTYSWQAEELQMNRDNLIPDVSGLPEISQRYLGRETVTGTKRPGAFRII
jgi:hypothetical protein